MTSCLGTGTSIKSGGIFKVVWAQTFSFSEIMDLEYISIIILSVNTIGDIRMTRVVLSVMLIFQIDEAVPIFSFFSFVFFCDIASTS